MKTLLLLGTALGLSAAAPAFAQDDNAAITTADAVRDDHITVLATGSATNVDKAGQPIDVIGADEIDSVQGPDITRVLQRLPGVTIASNGGLGSATSLFVRGANSQQVLVMVDGIRVADVAATGGGYDFGNLMTGSIGKIELLRGSNSVVWGSDAIGGVLNVTSRDVNGVEARAEYGSRNSFDGQMSAGVSGDTYGVTLDGGYTRTDGISQAAIGTEDDGFHQWRVGGHGHVELMPGLTASLAGRYTQGKLDIDGYPAPSYITFDDTDDYQKTREIGGRGALDWTGDTLSLGVAYQLSDTRRRYYGESYNYCGSDSCYFTHGQSRRAELTGSWNAWRDLRLDFGADHEWSRMDESDDARHHANLSSAHALLGWYSQIVNLAAGVRYDDHSRFGGAWTFGANGSVAVVGQWRVIASYGEGFKAPSLYQLYSNYGDTSLKAERSRSYDAGIEYGDRNGPLYFALTGFRRDTRNLIDFVSCVGDEQCEARPYGLYANVGKARATGAELELGAQVSPALHAQAVYTYTKSVNRTSGDANESLDLARRPRNALTLSLDWTSPLHGLKLGGDLRMVSDSWNDAANTTQIDGWATGTIRASMPITDKVEVFARVENVTDVKYELVTDYGTAGRSVFGGIRVTM
ncbi:TonB-dependent receptor plug domain-containing protein [Novosphingobium sp. 9]|uniref:TonB-dependent receptor plug domain-containing protein n=1 Tax=Novosphingobium sp. 9 TaxID=2025349 RepID=UPI0021B56790|nr:TonB-dependent receptor [Novosphingobium sp. 9]